MRPSFACTVAASCLLAPEAVQAFAFRAGLFVPAHSSGSAHQQQQQQQHATTARLISPIPGAPRDASGVGYGRPLIALRMSSTPREQQQQAGEARRALSATALGATMSTSSVDMSVSGSELAAAPGEKSKFFKAYEKGSEYFTNLFPVWLTMFSLVALKDPSMFAWFTTK